MRFSCVAVCLSLPALMLAGCGGGDGAGDAETRSAGADTVAAYATPGKARSGVVDQRAALPRIVDLGEGDCIPCKMMAPVLDELAGEYRGRVIIEVIDVGDRPEAARQYGMRVMPTQVFLDARGNEVWRHEGFLPKEKIVEKLREMGVEPPDG